MKTAELQGAAFDEQFCAEPKRVVFINKRISVAVLSGSAYLSRSGRSVAVTLHGPKSKHRVYLPVICLETATEPRHLLNLAMHKSGKWINQERADHWFSLVVDSCRPMRLKCKPLLTAIGKIARQHYGEKYWRCLQGRAFLKRELALMGIKCPPVGPTIEFV